MNTMKNSDIYKTAILAVIDREEITETLGLSEDDLLEVLYRLTQDWYWSRAAEEDEEAKAKEALEQMQEEMRRVSEAYGEETND